VCNVDDIIMPPVVISSQKQARKYLGTAHLPTKAKIIVDRSKSKALHVSPTARAFVRIKLDHVIVHFYKQKQLIAWSGLFYEPAR
jgi:hypothetical protein